MAIEPKTGRLHLVWLQAARTPPLGGFPEGDNPILAAYSDDGGRTFSKPVRVSDPERRFAVAPALVLGGDGRVYVLYYDLGKDVRDYKGLEGPVWEGTWSLVITRSGQGRGFTRGTVVDSDIVPPERVMLIFTMPPASIEAGTGDEVVAAWHDRRNGDWDVFMRRSVDSGVSWSPPLRLNDDFSGGKHQYLPQLAARRGGGVDAIFYDRRNDEGNVRNDVYHAFTPDGRRIGANLRITSENSDSTIGQRYPLVPSALGQVEFGSRVGLAATGQGLVAAWTDTRNSLGSTQQDIFSTRLEFPSSVGPAMAGPLAALAVLVGTVAVSLLIIRSGARVAPGTPAVAASRRP